MQTGSSRVPAAASVKKTVPRPGGGFAGGGRRLLAVLLVPLLASGCISEEEEQAIGNQLAEEVNPRLPLIDEPILNAYLYTVGRRIAAVSERPDLEYRFYIIDTDEPNAFALPGGHIYLTRGLIGRIRNGSEFAGALAHEIGHVAARHGVAKLQRHMRTGSVVSLLYDTFLGGEPGILQENALDLAGVVWAAHHSRREESEADRLAVEYLTRSGIPSRGVVTLLQTFLADEATEDPHGGVGGWLATHPLTQQRIRQAQREIDRVSTSEQTPELGAELESYPLFQLLVNRHPRLPVPHTPP